MLHNSIIDMQSDPYTDINTGHKMVAIKVRQKLKAREEPSREPTLKGIKPEKEGQSKEETLDNYIELRNQLRLNRALRSSGFWSLSQEDLIYCAWTFGKTTRVK